MAIVLGRTHVGRATAEHRLAQEDMLLPQSNNSLSPHVGMRLAVDGR